jgi:hypothetical protein
MTDKMRIETALAGLSDLVQDVETDGFPAAVLHLLPELWRLFQKHRGDVHAMRAALQAAVSMPSKPAAFSCLR